MDNETTPGTILVADDEPDIVALVERRLTNSGFAVITAVNGEDALQTARAHLPDLVLLDVMMPKLSGIEVSRLLRSAPETHPIPVILMSAGLVNRLTIPDDADAFIAKPFSARALPELVREVLARTRRGALTRDPA
jgi:DNA-binding response OmpR family regulator